MLRTSVRYVVFQFSKLHHFVLQYPQLWEEDKMYEEQRGLAMPSYATHKFWFSKS